MVRYSFIKKSLICGLCALMITGLAGCKSESSSSAVESTAESVSQKGGADGVQPLFAKQILQKCEDSSMTQSAYYGNDTFNNVTEKLYGIEIEKIYDGGIICGEDGSSDEVSVLKLADGSSATELLEERLEQRKELFKDYKPEEIPKLDKAEVFEQNGWNCLVISENASEIKDKILELI